MQVNLHNDVGVLPRKCSPFTYTVSRTRASDCHLNPKSTVLALHPSGSPNPIGRITRETRKWRTDQALTEASHIPPFHKGHVRITILGSCQWALGSTAFLSRQVYLWTLSKKLECKITMECHHSPIIPLLVHVYPVGLSALSVEVNVT